MNQDVYVPRSTAERLLDVAQDLIQQKGYNGFSYEDLSQIVGLKKPSIHHHFPRKEDLGAQVIERYTERFKGFLENIDDASIGIEGRLEAYVALFSNTYGQARKLCPCGMLGAELSVLPALVADAVQAFFSLNLEWLTQLLELGRKKGQLGFTEDAAAQAFFVLSALEGAMVVGRGVGGVDPVKTVGRILITNLVELNNVQNR